MSELPCSDIISMFKSQIFCVLRVLRCICIVLLIYRLYAVAGGAAFVFEFWGKSAVMWLSLCLVIGDHQLRPEQRPKFSVSQPHKTSSNAAVSKPAARKKHEGICGGFSFSFSLILLEVYICVPALFVFVLVICKWMTGINLSVLHDKVYSVIILQFTHHRVSNSCGKNRQRLTSAMRKEKGSCLLSRGEELIRTCVIKHAHYLQLALTRMFS